VELYLPLMLPVISPRIAFSFPLPDAFALTLPLIRSAVFCMTLSGFPFPLNPFSPPFDGGAAGLLLPALAIPLFVNARVECCQKSVNLDACLTTSLGFPTVFSKPRLPRNPVAFYQKAYCSFDTPSSLLSFCSQPIQAAQTLSWALD